MADACTNIYEYERILLGQQDKYWATFQNEKGSLANKREFGIIWRYAISELLHWSFSDAMKYLNMDVIKTIKLNTTFYAINFNPKHHFISNFNTALQLAFPEEKVYDFTAETILEYKKVAKKDEWQNDTNITHYNSNFFRDINGLERARIIFNWLIHRYLGDMSAVELYDMFSDEDKALQFSIAHTLETPRETLYSNDMLDYFHDSYELSDDYLYYRARIKKKVKDIID